MFIVVGSKASSNANRLREVAERLGDRAYLVDDADGPERTGSPESRVAVTAGASTPEYLVKQVLSKLADWGHGGAVLAGGASESGIPFAPVLA